MVGDRMKTIEDFKIAIQKKLLDLENLEKNPWNQTKFALGEKSSLAEKDAGRLFYEAEEILDLDALIQLKKSLNVDERQWRLYKSKFINHPPEKD
jgi:hypothetical protein